MLIIPPLLYVCIILILLLPCCLLAILYIIYPGCCMALPLNRDSWNPNPGTPTARPDYHSRNPNSGIGTGLLLIIYSSCTWNWIDLLDILHEWLWLDPLYILVFRPWGPIPTTGKVLGWGPMREISVSAIQSMPD